ncbi:MAG: MFS transporter [Holosporaceae bacterium]|nr:MAG: MFS transporter [Holosporaceae bacterium]
MMCAMAPTIEMLLLARFLQGSVVSTVTVVGYAAVHELYTRKKTVKLLSIMASVILIAPASGPIVGSWVLEFFSWRVIFYLISALGVLGALGIYLFMPNDGVRQQISFQAVIQDYKAPIKNGRFMRYGIGLSILISTFFVWIVESPFVIVSGLKHAPSVFGWAQLFVFGSGIGSQVAKFLVDRLHVSGLIRLAVTIIALGFICFIGTSYFTNNLLLNVGSMMLIGIGASQTFGGLNRLAVESSNVTMVSRTALISLMTSLTGTIASFIMTLFNNQTFFNMALVIAGFLCVGLCLIISGTKTMAFRDEN